MTTVFSVVSLEVVFPEERLDSLGCCCLVLALCLNGDSFTALDTKSHKRHKTACISRFAAFDDRNLALKFG